MLNCYKCFLTPESTIRDSVNEVLNDGKVDDINEKSNFWLFVAALKRFYSNTHSMPLSGKVPDMTSTTEFYITLQNM
jgi:NEDD8-activating enzyme E1 regulatory subunit